MKPQRRSWRTTVAARYASLAALLWALLSATGSVARADDVYDPDVTREARLARRGPVNLLPETLAARVTDDRATATTWAGYDGAMHAPLLTATVEARIAGRLALVAGGGYTAEVPGALALRPRLGLRAQLLDQAKSGVDGGLAVTYRQDWFTAEGGFLQAAVAVGRRQGPVQILGNLVYGIDPAEGDDHEGELRLACLLEARPGLLIGVDGRYSHDSVVDRSEPRCSGQADVRADRRSDRLLRDGIVGGDGGDGIFDGAHDDHAKRIGRPGRDGRQLLTWTPQQGESLNEDQNVSRLDQIWPHGLGGGVLPSGARRRPASATPHAARDRPVRHADRAARRGATVSEPGPARVSELRRRRGGALAAQPRRQRRWPILCAGQNSLDKPDGTIDTADSTQFIFLYDVSGAHREAPVLTQVIQQTNAHVGLVFSPDGSTLYAAGGRDDAVYAYTKSGGVLVAERDDRAGPRRQGHRHRRQPERQRPRHLRRRRDARGRQQLQRLDQRDRHGDRHRPLRARPAPLLRRQRGRRAAASAAPSRSRSS